MHSNIASQRCEAQFSATIGATRPSHSAPRVHQVLGSFSWQQSQRYHPASRIPMPLHNFWYSCMLPCRHSPSQLIQLTLPSANPPLSRAHQPRSQGGFLPAGLRFGLALPRHHKSHTASCCRAATAHRNSFSSLCLLQPRHHLVHIRPGLNIPSLQAGLCFGLALPPPGRKLMQLHAVMQLQPTASRPAHFAFCSQPSSRAQQPLSLHSRPPRWRALWPCSAPSCLSN